jgi:hypothetical protein
MPRKRPFSVTLLIWLVLSLSVWGVVRLLAALRWWDVLNEFGARLGPLYLSITGMGWVVVGGVLLWGLFSGKRWTPLAFLVSVCLWFMEYWVERIFFQSSRANFSFALIASILLLIVALVSTRNRQTRKFFIRSEEHE